MPDPKKYKNQNDWMDACMHQLRREEGVPQDQAVGKCLGMWRGRNKKKKGKKCASEYIRDIARRLKSHA